MFLSHTDLSLSLSLKSINVSLDEDLNRKTKEKVGPSGVGLLSGFTQSSKLKIMGFCGLCWSIIGRKESIRDFVKKVGCTNI